MSDKVDILHALKGRNWKTSTFFDIDVLLEMSNVDKVIIRLEDN